jgi:hypothetical protein
MHGQSTVDVHDRIEVLRARETVGKHCESGWLLVERQVQASGEPLTIRVLKVELLELHDPPLPCLEIRNSGQNGPHGFKQAPIDFKHFTVFRNPTTFLDAKLNALGVQKIWSNHTESMELGCDPDWAELHCVLRNNLPWN